MHSINQGNLYENGNYKELKNNFSPCGSEARIQAVGTGSFKIIGKCGKDSSCNKQKLEFGVRGV